jgi:RNA polymerase sigma factor (sigma-70 family)
MDYKEQLLIADAQRGDVDAFNALVHLYEQRVYRLCYRMLSDADGAADVSQEVFLAAYNHLPRFHGTQFRAWLLRIAANACYDVLRSRKRRNTVSLDALREPDNLRARFDPPDTGELPEASALRRELGAALAQSLQQLPPEQRIVVVLSDLEGLAYDEIALATGMQLGTVKSRLSRARARLRDILCANALLPRRYLPDTSESRAALEALAV